MFIELVEILRCRTPHEESWLVASIDVLDGRQIVNGSLGCPVCRAQYPIVGGVVSMRPDVRDAIAPDEPLEATRFRDTDEVVRAAALLGIGDGGGRYVLAGTGGRLVRPLEEATGATFLLVSPPSDVLRAGGLSIVQSGAALPVAAGALRGVLVDEWRATSRFLDDAVRALGAGGRLVAPADVPVPDGVRLLARDEREWVAEREGTTTPPVPLRRR